MNKRLISLLLVIVMICTLLPLSVLATGAEEDTRSSATGFADAIRDVFIADKAEKVTYSSTKALKEALKDEGKGLVVVPVFGKELSDTLMNSNKGLFENTSEALQVRLSGKTVIPDVEIILSDGKGNEQTLKKANMSILGGLNPEADPEFKLEQLVDKCIEYLRQDIESGLTYARDQMTGAVSSSWLPTGITDRINGFIEGATQAQIEEALKKIDSVIEKFQENKNDLLYLLGTGSLSENTKSNIKSSLITTILDALLSGYDGMGVPAEYCDSTDRFVKYLYDNKYAEDINDKLATLLEGLGTGYLAQFATGAYQNYVSEKLDPGNYTISIQRINNRQGFKKIKSDVREYDFKVEEGELTYVGDSVKLSTRTLNLETFFMGVDEEAPEEDPAAPESEELPAPEVPDETNFILDAYHSLVGFQNQLTSTVRSVVSTISNKMNDGTITILNREYDLPFYVYFSLTFHGIFLDREDPYIGFINEDLGGNAIPNVGGDTQPATFVMVDRDQLLKVTKAIVEAGQDAFNNVRTGLLEVFRNDGSNEEIPTWNEFVELHQQLLNLEALTASEESEGTTQTLINPDSLYEILKLYWGFLDVKSIWKDFMSEEKDVRFPAILEATADKNGKVRISENSNITLTWSLKILVQMADLSEDAIQEIAGILTGDAQEEGVIEAAVAAAMEGANLDNEALKTILSTVLVKITELAADGGEAAIEILKDTADLAVEEINKWIYPILQNDALFRAMFYLTPDLAITHAPLTDKMPDSYYLLFQLKAPEGYMINPMFYTVRLDWADDGWVYAKIANLGIVLPYFVEDYYTFLRNNSIAKTSDAILNRISNGKYETLIQDIISGKVNATDQVVTASATGIAFQSWIMYNFMGGRFIYSEGGQEALQADLIKWLKAKGNTAQNLLGFGNEVYTRSKAVVTADLNGDDWAFYNASKSIKENIVVQATAIMKGISESIVTDGSKVNKAVQEAINNVIKGAEKVDTTSKLVAAVDMAKQKITETVTKATTSLITTAIKKTASLFSSLFKNLKG